jgi:hypothetical protein
MLMSVDAVQHRYDAGGIVLSKFISEIREPRRASYLVSSLLAERFAERLLFSRLQAFPGKDAARQKVSVRVSIFIGPQRAVVLFPSSPGPMSK